MQNDLGALMLWIDRKLNRNQDVLVTKIDSIQNLFETSAEATASSADVLEGKTAYNGNALITGTMENQGAKEATLLAGGTYNIPRGFHDGAGRVTATDLTSQTPGTAGAGGILEGLKAWVAGKLVNGSMKDRRGTTVDAGTVTQDDEYTYLSIPEEACFDSNSKVRTENSNFTPEFELVEGVCKPGDVIDLKKQIVAIAIAYDRKSMLTSASFWAVSFGNLYRYPTSTNAIIIDGTRATLTYRGGVAAGGGTGDTDPADYYMALVVK